MKLLKIDHRVLLILAPVLLIVFFTLFAFLGANLRSARQQIIEEKEVKIRKENSFNKFGLNGSRTLAEKPVGDFEEGQIYEDRIVNKLILTEGVETVFSEQMEALQGLVGKYAKIAVLPVPKRAQLEPELAQESNAAYEAFLSRLSAAIPKDIMILDALPGLQGDSEHFLFYRMQDTWTMDGAYYGYQKVCEALEKTAFDIDYFDAYSYNTYAGTLGEEWKSVTEGTGSGLREIIDSIPNDPFVYRYSKNLKNYERVCYIKDDQEYKRPVIIHSVSGSGFVIGGSVRYARIFGNGEGNLFVLADSCGKMFVPYMAEHFANILFVDIERCGRAMLEKLMKQYPSSEFVVAQMADRIGNSSYTKTFNELLE